MSEQQQHERNMDGRGRDRRMTPIHTFTILTGTDAIGLRAPEDAIRSSAHRVVDRFCSRTNNPPICDGDRGGHMRRSISPAGPSFRHLPLGAAVRACDVNSMSSQRWPVC